MPKKCLLSHTVVESLILEVSKQPCIWNPNHEDYNDRVLIAQAWIEISKKLEQPEEVLRSRWKNLRDLFIRVLKRINNSNNESASQWRYFQALSFLRPVFIADHSENDQESTDVEEDIDKTFVKFENYSGPDNGEVEVFIDPDTGRLDIEDPIPDKRRKVQDEDFDMMFLKSLTPYMRRLDPIRKLVVRSKMQDMLLNEIAAQNTVSKLS